MTNELVTFFTTVYFDCDGVFFVNPFRIREVFWAYLNSIIYINVVIVHFFKEMI